jgi:hypothetical protein
LAGGSRYEKVDTEGDKKNEFQQKDWSNPQVNDCRNVGRGELGAVRQSA